MGGRIWKKEDTLFPYFLFFFHLPWFALGFGFGVVVGFSM